jgi:hypothetical protein
MDRGIVSEENLAAIRKRDDYPLPLNVNWGTKAAKTQCGGSTEPKLSALWRSLARAETATPVIEILRQQSATMP